MSVLNLMPHTLRYCIVGEAYQDEDGHWHPGTEGWSEPIKCHAVPSSGPANVITYPDGKTSTYSYLVERLRPDCREFMIGEKIKLNIFGTEREYQVKGFHRGQTQSRIWV